MIIFFCDTLLTGVSSPNILCIPQSICPKCSKSLENYKRGEFFQCLSVNLPMSVDPGLGKETPRGKKNL